MHAAGKSQRVEFRFLRVSQEENVPKAPWYAVSERSTASVDRVIILSARSAEEAEKMASNERALGYPATVYQFVPAMKPDCAEYYSFATTPTYRREDLRDGRPPRYPRR